MPVTQQPSDRVRATIEQWKGALLDLSPANPLVGLPESGTVPMAAPNDVFDPLVRRRKPLHFWDMGSPNLDRTVLREAGHFALRQAGYATIRNLHLQAVALLQGQDINVLYVSFGVLRWSPDSDGETVYRSPLLLVPVALEPHESGCGFVMSCMEEPVEVNPVLRLRLARPDIGVTLPPAPDERYLVPSAYLSGVTSNVCEGREGWEVEDTCLLGSFPLLKLRLYEDFVAQEAKALGHPLIAAIAGEEGALQNGMPAVEVPALGHIEASHAGEGGHLLLDADPAQERAILAAARGQSFVLQGPPGTGKTQTITNIITECIAAGKSVLLCSGRMASLDAVHQRLIEKNIGDLCLVAHSLKTSKRDILQQLEQTLSAPVKAAPAGTQSRAQRAKESEELDAVRDRLNTFVRALHEKRGPMGATVYEAVGRIAENRRLAGAAGKDFRFPLDSSPLDVSTELLASMEAEAVRLAAHPALSEAPAVSPLWAGAFLEPDRAGLPDAVRAALAALTAALARVAHGAASLAPLCGLPVPDTLSGADALLAKAGLFAAAPVGMLTAWLDGGEGLSGLRGTAAGLATRFSALREEREVLLRVYDSEILTLPHAALSERLSDKFEGALRPLLGDSWRDRAVAECKELCDSLGSVAQKSRDLHEKLVFLSERSGLPLDESPEGRVNLLRIARRSVDLPNPCVGWFTPGAAERLGAQLAEAQEQWWRHNKRAEDLFAVFDESILELDHTPIKEALAQQKGGLLGLLNPSATRAANSVKACAKAGVSVKDRDLGKDLDAAAEIKELRRWGAANADRLQSAFGSYYKGAATDWDVIRQSLAKAQALCAEFPDGRVPAPLIALMLLGDSDLKEFEQVGNTVGDTLNELREAWERLALADPSGAGLPSPAMPLVEIAAWCDVRRKALHDLHDAHRQVASLRLSKDAALSAFPVAGVVEDLRRAAAAVAARAVLDTESALAAPKLGPLFCGAETDWAMLEAALDAAAGLRDALTEGGRLPFPAEALTALAALTAPEGAARREEVAVTLQTLREDREALAPALSGLETLFRPEYLDKGGVGGARIADTPIPALSAWAAERVGVVEQIAGGAGAQRARDEAAPLGLTGFFDALSAAPLPEQSVLPAFRAGFWEGWVAAASAASPGLSAFGGAEAGKEIARFCELDRRQMETVPAQIRELVKARPPKQHAEEVKALKGQLARRRTGEVRRLLAEIPNLLVTLKPCIMMNPLSVRLFLDADALHFDVVLFDDASQISTEDAVGAILRGKQVIIAGDPKQIPPLALLRPTDRPFESILDAASAVADKESAHFSEYPLRWHYRSMNESLIAFSRRHFYPELVSFPAARVDSAISFLGTTDDPVAAPARVVDALLEYARKNPDHSVGVIALDEIDHDALLAEIARRREADPEFALPREDEDVEHFFVKTLENVQGDERDMVLLYVGTEPGRCAPLSAPGGERLLNVATTRARHQMVVVSALSSVSAAASAAEEPGVRLLRAFLDYAQNGGGLGGGAYGAVADVLSRHLVGANGASPAAGPAAQGELERVIERALTQRGHSVRRQVGVSEYKVDLALIDPEDPERYVLGIECDGPMYASGETARHRDRLRPEMLTVRGWNLHRVWSLDFARDPEGQLRAIEAAYEAARSGKGTAGKAVAKRKPSRKAQAAAEAEAAAVPA